MTQPEIGEDAAPRTEAAREFLRWLRRADDLPTRAVRSTSPTAYRYLVRIESEARAQIAADFLAIEAEAAQGAAAPPDLDVERLAKEGET